MSTISDSVADRPPSVWRRWWFWAAIIIGLIFFFPRQSTFPLTIPGIGRYDALSYGRWQHYWANADGRGVDTILRLHYYSQLRRPDLMRKEARRIAPALLAEADKVGLRIVELKPAKPVLWKAFPLANISYNVRYERQADGTWRETTPAEPEAATP